MYFLIERNRFKINFKNCVEVIKVFHWNSPLFLKVVRPDNKRNKIKTRGIRNEKGYFFFSLPSSKYSFVSVFLYTVMIKE